MGDAKRVTVFAGHYGSGKSNLAVNYALKLKESGKGRVAIADLDIVNPYFRTKDAEEMLEEKGVHLISSPYANSNVDTPALPAEAYAAAEDRELYAVIDVGGDDRGATALGRYVPSIKEENNYEMIFVINKSRPLTADAAGTLEVMREIEDSAGLRFTGIVNNTNLGAETTAAVVRESLGYAKEVSALSGLPILFTSVNENLVPELPDVPDLFPMKLFIHQSFM